MDLIAPNWVPPCNITIGKSIAQSLMQLQLLAKQLLLVSIYMTRLQYLISGAPTGCGPDWSDKAIPVVQKTGTHMLVLNPKLMWDEVQYQVNKDFVTIIKEKDLFAANCLKNMKIS
jgi:hypothetical protein